VCSGGAINGGGSVGASVSGRRRVRGGASAHRRIDDLARGEEREGRGSREDVGEAVVLCG
jgi:hypothetical protein